MDVKPVGDAGQALPAAPAAASPNWLVENRELIRSVKSINAAELFGDGKELTFALDWETKRPVVRVIDRQSGEILFQSPPDYMLRLAEVMGKAGARGRASPDAFSRYEG
jgi:uncharacterized FlaG/YvyC family protein